MRRFIAGLVAGVVIAMALPVLATEVPEPTPVEQEKPITLVVNGQTITLPDAQPRVVDGQVMVPVIAFSRVAGFGVAWDEANRALIVRTPQANTEQKPAKEEPPLTIEVNGVTYYEHNSVMKFLVSVLPDTRVAIGKRSVVVGNQNFEVDEQYANNKAYKDLRLLIRSGIITQEQLDTYYGK